MQHMHSVGIILFHTHNNMPTYLLLQHPERHWDFPKGKQEIGETDNQTALRELKEETGLTAQLLYTMPEKISYIFTTSDGIRYQKTVTFFIGQTDTTDVVLSYEHHNYKWLSFEQALQQLTYENSRELLKKANEWTMGVKKAA